MQASKEDLQIKLQHSNTNHRMSKEDNPPSMEKFAPSDEVPQFHTITVGNSNIVVAVPSKDWTPSRIAGY